MTEFELMGRSFTEGPGKFCFIAAIITAKSRLLLKENI